MRSWPKTLLLITVGFFIGFGVAKIENKDAMQGASFGESTFKNHSLQTEAPHNEGRTKSKPARPDVVLQRLIENLPAAANADTVEAINVPELRQQLQSLHEQVQELTDEATLIRGKPLPFPDDIEPRFQAVAVRKALNEALRQRGVSSEIEALDCDEFPCIGCGRVGTGQNERWVGDEVDRIRGVGESIAMQPYRDDEHNTSVWKSLGQPKEGEPSATFCMTLYPKDTYPVDDVDKRTGYRIREMLKEM